MRFESHRIPFRLALSIFLLGAFCIQFASAQATRIEISTLPGLRYDVKTFYALPGENVTIVFSNNDDMLHNLVVTKPETRLAVVQAALELGAAGAESGYIPESSNVLWYAPVVASGASYTLEFVAPKQVGEYPFVCTYPGHGLVMFGTMVVASELKDPEMNSVEMPMSGASHANHDGHSKTAIVTRCFMPDAGPASIAVGLPGGYSYCWDAGAVRFRYAWHGGFIEEVYRKPSNLSGNVFYREMEEAPIRVGADPIKQPSEVQFRGYRLDELRYPEFEYSVDGIVIRERLSASYGVLERRLVVEKSAAANGVWFATSSKSIGILETDAPRDGVFYRFPESGVLELRMPLNSKGGSHE